MTTQDPAAGTLVPFGTTVAARLEPPPTPGPMVPRLLGISTEAEGEGSSRRARAGSRRRFGHRRRRAPGQRAGPCSRHPIGRSRAVTVTLTGSTTRQPDPTVAVPDVTGLEAAAVQRVLEAAGLTLAVDPTGPETGPARSVVPPGP